MMFNDTVHINITSIFICIFIFISISTSISKYTLPSEREALSNIRFLWRGFINYTLPLERLYQLYAPFGEALSIIRFLLERLYQLFFFASRNSGRSSRTLPTLAQRTGGNPLLLAGGPREGARGPSQHRAPTSVQ
jgi:hypothetical protein